MGTWPSGKGRGADESVPVLLAPQERTPHAARKVSQSFDNPRPQSYCYILGGRVRQGIQAILLLLLTAVLCVSAIPQTDLPETSYNEVDTPVNQAPPVVPRVRLVRPPVAPVILPTADHDAKQRVEASARDRKSVYPPIPHNSRSLQDLLCTLLI